MSQSSAQQVENDVNPYYDQFYDPRRPPFFPNFESPPSISLRRILSPNGFAYPSHKDPDYQVSWGRLRLKYDDRERYINHSRPLDDRDTVALLKIVDKTDRDSEKVASLQIWEYPADDRLQASMIDNWMSNAVRGSTDWSVHNGAQGGRGNRSEEARKRGRTKYRKNHRAKKAEEKKSGSREKAEVEQSGGRMREEREISLTGSGELEDRGQEDDEGFKGIEEWEKGSDNGEDQDRLIILD